MANSMCEPSKKRDVHPEFLSMRHMQEDRSLIFGSVIRYKAYSSRLCNKMEMTVSPHL